MMYNRVMIGDRCVQDLTPPGLNIGNRIIKNMRIAGSGIYSYHRSELASFGLDNIPEQYAGRTVFNIYRPPDVLKKNAQMFARIPIITGEHQAVTLDNAKQLTVGLTGDTVDYEVDPQDGEVYLYTTGTIITGDGLSAYKNDGQLSCGYVPTASWEGGVHKGVEYQATLTGFDDVNHILICHTARGGPQCMFMDSIKMEDKKMGILDRFFGKREALAGDTSSDIVSVLLQSITVGADPKVQVPKIRKEKVRLTGDSARIFKEYLSELEEADEEPATIQRAASIVLDFYRTAIGDSCGGEHHGLPGDEEDKKEAGDEDEEDKKEAGDEEDKDKMNGDAIKVYITETINAVLPAMVAASVESAMKPYKTTGDSNSLIESSRKVKSESASTLIQNWIGGLK